MAREPILVRCRKDTVAVKKRDGLAENLANQLGRVFRAEFFQQVSAVEFDGARTDLKRAGDLFAGVPLDDFGQDQKLPRSQMSIELGN